MNESRELADTLTITPTVYKDIVSGIKTFIIRKDNICKIKPGDTLKLKEWEFKDDFPEGDYTGNEILARIMYIEFGCVGIMTGYSIIGIKPLKQIIDMRGKI